MAHQPDRPRSFRVPWGPLLPMISIACCLVLMLSRPLETGIRFFVCLAIGLTIYFCYGQKRSLAERGTMKTGARAIRK